MHRHDRHRHRHRYCHQYHLHHQPLPLPLLTRQFRLLMAKREASNRWLMLLETARQNAALVIQMAFRCHSARVAFEVMRIAIVGKRIYAARVVLRAWLRSRDGAKFRQLKEAWEVEKSAEVLMELNEERSEVGAD